MPAIQEIQVQLSRVQSRRKATIWCLGTLFVPGIILVGAYFRTGTWQREAIELTGLVLIIIAMLGRAWCILYIGGRKTSSLIRSGPYSVSRNPLYLFSFIAAAGLGAQTGSISVVLFMLFAAYLIFLPVVFREEAGLLAAHGQAYKDYRQSTPRFFPKPGLWRDADAVMVNPRIWMRTIADGMAFVLLAVLIRGLAWFQSAFPDLPLVVLF